MTHIRFIDEIGNETDYESTVVPRIGERIFLRYGVGGGPIRDHYFRVKDVEYRLQNDSTSQAAILVEEEQNPEPWLR